MPMWRRDVGQVWQWGKKGWEMASTMRVERTRRNFADESNRYDAKRERLVQCARELAEQGNAAKVSVTDVTSAMGITRGLFYYYFGGKEELSEAISMTYVDDLLKQVRQATEQIESREDAVHAIVACVHEWLYDEQGARRPMWHVLDEMNTEDLVQINAAIGLGTIVLERGLLTDYSKVGDEVLAERARFVAMGILGECRLNSSASIELVSDAACSALRYRKRRNPA